MLLSKYLVLVLVRLCLGVWKSSALISNGSTNENKSFGYGLISEAVSPGFDYADMQIGQADELVQLFPQHRALIFARSKVKSRL